MLNTKFVDINQKYTPPQLYNSYTLFATERKPLQVINHNKRIQRVPPGFNYRIIIPPPIQIPVYPVVSPVLSARSDLNNKASPYSPSGFFDFTNANECELENKKCRRR